MTEELWPGQRVSRASYVVSMLQPKVVADLELTKFGYDPIPLDPEFATFAADGRPMLLPNDDKVTYEQVARVSRKDADALAPFNALFEKAALFLKPLMLRPPPAAGSKRPGDVFELLREAGRAAGMSRRDLTDIFRLMTMSVGDLLDDHFETDELKGAYASSGVVGVWAGPYTPGTAYNLLHHALGEVDGVQGAWGHVRGGMGAISEAIAASARAAGATVRTGAPVASIDVEGGRVTGVTLVSGETLSAPLVMSGAHPKRTVLDLVGAEHFPDEVAQDMRRYRTRGASVKINAVLSEPPRYVNAPDGVSEQLLHASVAICPSIPYLERAWQDAQRGVPAEGPYIEVEVPTAVDPSLTDDGTTVLTMFTQFGPHAAEDWPDGAREAYAQRCFVAAGPARAQRARRDPALRGARAARPRADLRAGGRLDLPGRAGPRPDGLHAPDAGARALRDARARALPVRGRHPPGRRGHRRLGPQRRAPRAARPARGAHPRAPAPSRRGRPRLNGHSVHIGAARWSRTRVQA